MIRKKIELINCSMHFGIEQMDEFISWMFSSRLKFKLIQNKKTHYIIRILFKNRSSSFALLFPYHYSSFDLRFFLVLVIIFHFEFLNFQLDA